MKRMITEIMDSPYEVTGKRGNTRDGFHWDFSSEEGHSYRVYLTGIFTMPDSCEGEEALSEFLSALNVDFHREDDPYPEVPLTLKVKFSEFFFDLRDEKYKGDRRGITGFGKPFRVLSTLSSLFTKEIPEAIKMISGIDIMIFSAKEKSRARVYDRLSKLAAKSLNVPMTSVTIPNPFNTGIKETYYLFLINDRGFLRRNL